MEKSRLNAEIERIKKEFPAADANKVRALDALIEQAAYWVKRTAGMLAMKKPSTYSSTTW